PRYGRRGGRARSGRPAARTRDGAAAARVDPRRSRGAPRAPVERRPGRGLGYRGRPAGHAAQSPEPEVLGRRLGGRPGAQPARLGPRVERGLPGHRPERAAADPDRAAGLTGDRLHRPPGAPGSRRAPAAPPRGKPGLPGGAPVLPTIGNGEKYQPLPGLDFFDAAAAILRAEPA